MTSVLHVRITTGGGTTLYQYALAEGQHFTITGGPHGAPPLQLDAITVRCEPAMLGADLTPGDVTAGAPRARAPRKFGEKAPRLLEL